ncbi:MAG: hypothetical protein LBP85_03135, partial [Prevotellaceae bacterium]|nr:hypothetical protein [Prevotellaceae bacterium]
ESEEKAVVYYLNYARINPRQFCEKYVKPHAPWYKGYAFDERKESLIETLNTMTPILGGEIKPDENLYELAQCFAAKSGELGITGHDRSATQCTYLTGTWGECCDYGHAGGLEIVLSLLIDAGENNAALGHRKICLDPAYTKIGVSMQPHRNYGNIAVLDFGN